ncbi:MAG: ThiF family adenylyltransferase [Alicyclobacillus herbarius]|uniref:ThiF family adenylyltransferase n=1 Tax=Alicyclobacillus herbarius TaxID=122960 RepID=UPI002352102D|nr:ThiF family adenylyltransferase [Alicyclobacillus herbarius]MCL6632679.1 ThiF family adenylyltransferase [Alicyclobacillus herbarius]
MDSRYSRQILFRPIGPAGQERLGRARVAVVGMGALGTQLATQLVRAGVGFVRLIDRDVVEPSNLQRQSLYDEEDARLGAAKAAAAREKLQRANSGVVLEAAVTDLTWRNAESLLADVDLIFDGTDNFEVRYLINDVSVKHRIPWVYGGAVSSYGTTAMFRPGETPCLECVFGAVSGGGHDTCDTVGVIAPVVNIIASLQVAEALKYLTGNTAALAPGLTHVDVWTNEFRSIAFPRPNPDCPCCGRREFRFLAPRPDSLAVSLCGRRTVQVRPEGAENVRMNLHRLAERLAAHGRVHHNDQLLRCDLGEVQLSVFADGRALIHGVEDVTTARRLYAQYIGM